MYGTQKKHLIGSFMINAKHGSVQTLGFPLIIVTTKVHNYIKT